MDRMTETVAIELGLATLAEAPVLARMSRDYIENGLRWRWQTSQIRSLIQDPDTVSLCARSQPLRRPNGVRTASIITISVMFHLSYSSTALFRHPLKPPECLLHLPLYN